MQAKRKTETDPFYAQQCPECQANVTAETKFCPSCRTPQWITCRDCGASVHAGIAYCPQCGADVQQLRIQKMHSEIARRSLTAARETSLSHAERFEHASQAGLAARRVLNLMPDDPKAEELLTAANRLTIASACQAAEETYRQKNLSASMFFWNTYSKSNPSTLRQRRWLARSTLTSKMAKLRSGSILMQDCRDRQSKFLKSL